jgi:hypothetical protein
MIYVQESDLRYFIDKSTIPEAGLGLFASQDLKADDWLEVIGVRVDGVSNSCSKYGERYKFLGPDMKSVILPLGYAGLVNHTNNRFKQNVEIRCMDKGFNKRSHHATQIVYYFLRDIAKGEELLGNYGDEYTSILSQFLKDTRVIEDNDEDWKKFLSFDLYRLGELL